MKKIIIFILILICLPIVYGETLELTEEEQIWLEEHQADTFSLGLDPYTGMDYFVFQNKEQGYVVDLKNIIETTLNINVEIVSNQTWSEVYQGLIDEDIDILFGANVTDERLEFMAFTQPVHRYPYAVFVLKEGPVKTLGDMDFRRIGFLEGDIAIELFTKEFSNITFEVIEFEGQLEGLKALSQNDIHGFITSGGGIEYDFIYRYPDVKVMTTVEDITSDMTLATHKNQEIFARILDKVIVSEQDSIEEAIQLAQINYNRKILNLSDSELDWLTRKEVATVGIVEDYLPFDYYKDFEYKGIAGAIINEISALIGIEFKYIYGDFDEIYDLALKGEVDILNMAKTSDRLDHFLFPRSFREERDHIYGNKSKGLVNDIYSLEGKTVAVINGFWHEQLLLKNLRNVTIVKTRNIQESMKLVNGGKVDYFIENPTVAEYYLTGLGYFNIVKKGETSSDSFLYFGINKNKQELASIIDKTLILVNYEEEKQQGLSTVPKLVSRNVTYLLMVIGILLIIVTIGIYMLVRAIKTLISEREKTAVLRDREHQMYLDPLTGLNNRLYFNSIQKELETLELPQGIIISDLNKLKYINDTMGHHVGDIYIKAYGKCLKNVFDQSIVCRMGGDEFLVIMKNSDETVIKEKIAELMEQLELCQIELEDQRIENIDVALGYYIRENSNEPLEQAMIEADNAMYNNKNYR
ncbi:MAG: transporter substrate-binding domain-containing protein [Clostridiales bacterium]|nr:transporter substrate-binding domain-containing protein [Clostridiales bacterium]